MKAKEPIRLLVADGHPTFRMGLVALIESQPDMTVVAEAGDGRTAIELCGRKKPDVVLMDLRMPGQPRGPQKGRNQKAKSKNEFLLSAFCFAPRPTPRGQGGVETMLALLKKVPEARVIVVTTYDLDEDIFRAIQAGAKSYLLKDMPREQIVATIREVYRGQHKLPPGVLSRLQERSRRRELTEREVEILQLIIKGRSNKEISNALFISEDTVKYHLKALFAKLGVQDRTEAAISALRHGIVHL